MTLPRKADNQLFIHKLVEYDLGFLQETHLDKDDIGDISLPGIETGIEDRDRDKDRQTEMKRDRQITSSGFVLKSSRTAIEDSNWSSL